MNPLILYSRYRNDSVKKRYPFNVHFLILLVFLFGCFQYPDDIDYPSSKISLYPGPEDMLELKNDSGHFLLISCLSRRDIYEPYGNIIKYDLESGESFELPRMGEPADFNFRPHGIDFRIINKIPFLYVVLHDDVNDYHPIARYEVKENELRFDRVFLDPGLISPNAISVLENGSFFVCNDAGRRNSMVEKIFRLKRGNILFYNMETDEWKVVAENLAYPAGLLYHNNKIYVSAALENTVYGLLWDGEMARLKKPVLEIRAPDNIRICGNELIITNHLNPIKFMRHVSNPEKKSPSGVFAYNLEDKKARLIYWDDGENINAASTSLVIGSKLYISQIFEPYLLKVDLPEE